MSVRKLFTFFLLALAVAALSLVRGDKRSSPDGLLSKIIPPASADAPGGHTNENNESCEGSSAC